MPYIWNIRKKRKKVTLFVLPDFRIFKVKIIGVGQRRKYEAKGI